MKIKLDENIGRRGLELLTAAGHDVMTVRDQNLGGASDELLFEACAAERRTLITLDHDFGQVTRFPPEKSAGVVVLEVGRRANLTSIVGRLGEFLTLSRPHSVVGSLWIVEAGRIRIHLRRSEE